jgi:hypothetical protein
MKKKNLEYSVELLISPNIFLHDSLFPEAVIFFVIQKYLGSDGGQWGWVVCNGWLWW